jgi:hypothetical protein
VPSHGAAGAASACHTARPRACSKPHLRTCAHARKCTRVRSRCCGCMCASARHAPQQLGRMAVSALRGAGAGRTRRRAARTRREARSRGRGRRCCVAIPLAWFPLSPFLLSPFPLSPIPACCTIG